MPVDLHIQTQSNDSIFIERNKAYFKHVLHTHSRLVACVPKQQSALLVGVGWSLHDVFSLVGNLRITLGLPSRASTGQR